MRRNVCTASHRLSSHGILSAKNSMNDINPAAPRTIGLVRIFNVSGSWNVAKFAEHANNEHHEGRGEAWRPGPSMQQTSQVPASDFAASPSLGVLLMPWGRCVSPRPIPSGGPRCCAQSLACLPRPSQQTSQVPASDFAASPSLVLVIPWAAASARDRSQLQGPLCAMRSRRLPCPSHRSRHRQFR